MRHTASRARGLQVAGAAAPKAKAPVRECGVKDQVSWARHCWNGKKKRLGTEPMKRNNINRVPKAVAAGLLAATLAGCSIGPVNLPDIDLSFMGVVKTSVADARASIRASRTSPVDSSELIEAGYLTVGLLPSNTTPLLSTKTDGSHAGIDVEFAYAVADQLGLDVEFVTVSSASATGTQCDVVMGVSSSDAASTTGVSVVGAYAESAVGVFARGSEGQLAAADLVGKTVGVQPGSVSERTLSNTNLDIVEQTFTSINDSMSALAAGTIDAVVCDAYAGSYLASDYQGIGLLGTLDTPVSLGVAVSSSKAGLSSAVQIAVTAVQGNGQLDVIKSRWANSVGTLTSASMIQDINAAAVTSEAGSAATTAGSVATTASDSAAQ